jgi:VWFA-related protein
MYSQLLKRVLAAALLSGSIVCGCVGQSAPGITAEGLRIELPAHGQLRIENLFGEVAAEIWSENYVAVSTVIENDVSLKRSPVVIDNRSQLLVISIVRRPNDPVAKIKLAVKIPANARLEIVSGKNPTTMRGIPSAASIRSGAGNVTVQFLKAANADINAITVSGSVKSEIPQLLTDSGRVLQARVGAGTQTLKINTQGGSILLSVVDSEPARREEIDRRFADLTTPEAPAKAAGTPAPLSDTQEVSEGDVIRVDSQLVTLNMSVIDRNTNRGLVGLIKSDFRLAENGIEQQILQFESASAPFDLWLLIDVSGSTRDVMKLIRAAAIRFVEAARPYDRIGVVMFAGQPTMVSPLTLNRQQLRQRINATETATGDTKLYDATDFTMSQLSQDPKNRRRTAIIVMSDGLDGNIDGVQGEGSKLFYKDLLNRVQEFDGVVYTLWLNTEYEALSPLDTQPEAFDAGHDRMKQVADFGGGLFYEVERLEDLAGAYERVVADLGTVYSLAYRPSDKTRDGKWRAIQVNVNRPAAVARGKRGYFAN